MTFASLQLSNVSHLFWVDKLDNSKLSIKWAKLLSHLVDIGPDLLNLGFIPGNSVESVCFKIILFRLKLLNGLPHYWRDLYDLPCGRLKLGRKRYLIWKQRNENIPPLASVQGEESRTRIRQSGNLKIVWWSIYSRGAINVQRLWWWIYFCNVV